MNDESLTKEHEEPAAEGTALRLSTVSKTFRQGGRSLQVLDAVNLEVAPGEMVALVGPSGSGKSTLLQISGLLDQPETGEIFIQGRSSRKLSDTERTRLRRRTIGFVYQHHHLLPEFSALENVVLPQMIAGVGRGEARERARKLLEASGLGGRIDHRPAQMSGGEQQRVAIARALANTPSLLLADEPTGNLDPKTSEHVFQILMELVRGARLAALVATHNMQLAERMDRVLRLEGGHLRQIG